MVLFGAGWTGSIFFPKKVKSCHKLLWLGFHLFKYVWNFRYHDYLFDFGAINWLNFQSSVYSSLFQTLWVLKLGLNSTISYVNISKFHQLARYFFRPKMCYFFDFTHIRQLFAFVFSCIFLIFWLLTKFNHIFYL